MTTEIEKVGAAKPARPARPTAASRKAAASKTAEKAAAAGARVPKDHASAKTDVQPATVHLEWREDPETKKPFTYEVDTENFDDLEFVDAMISMESTTNQAEQTAHAFRALKAMLGPESFDLFKQREVLTQGKAKFTAAIQFYNSAMEQMKKGNSGPSPAA